MAVSEKPSWHDKRAADLMLAAPKTLPGAASVADVRNQFANPKVQMVLLADGLNLVGAITAVPDDATDDEPAVRYIDQSPDTISPGESGDVAFERALASPHRRVIVVGRGGELLGLLCLNAARTGFCQAPS
jgi:hypothetical protein